ncbi:MAG TPA: hypothetical protein VIG48_11090 [Jatrophihabitans sp.]
MTLDRAQLAELVPLIRRAADLDPATLVRVRRSGERLALIVRLPFGVLAARTLESPAADALDTTVRAGELLAWLDDDRRDRPDARDAEWRGGTPPDRGWHRIERVPDTELRPLVRTGALTLKQAAEREGVPGAQPRQEVADALLDSVVLSVGDQTHSADITLRTLSALTRLGFLARDSHAAVDVAGRWIRVVGAYGTVYAERPGAGLTLR